MAISVNKFAPSAVVLAFVGYCIWPSVSGFISTPPKPKPSEKIEPLDPALFTMPQTKEPTRNPWGGKDAETLAKIKKENEAKIAQEIQDKMKQDDPTAVSTVQPSELLKSLTLDATCIGGTSPLAIINNRIYGLQDTLADTEPGSPPCKVVGVLPYKVILECKGETLQLKYSSAASARPLLNAAADSNEEEATSDTPDPKTEKKPAGKKKTASQLKKAKAKISKAEN
jgi:hypothetical protein